MSIGLIVLSKPTFIMWYPLILFLILTSIKQFSKQEKIKSLIIMGIPVAILAVIQMIYNYLRFDNILEFGVRYQLTVFNQDSYTGINFSRLLVGISKYTLQNPYINFLVFPFVKINNSINTMALNQFHYENRLMGIAYIPLLWIFAFKKHIYKDSKELKWFVNISLITTFVLMFTNICAAGVSEAYTNDFKCILAISAIILLLRLISMNKNSGELKTLFLALAIATLIIMIPVNFTTENEWFSVAYHPVTIFLKNTFEFWT